MWFLAAYHTEFFAILADTLEVTLCYSSSENRLVNQSRPILSENEIGYFNTTQIKEALCNSQCSDTQNNFPNYRETNWSGNSQDSKIRKRQMCRYPPIRLKFCTYSYLTLWNWAGLMKYHILNIFCLHHVYTGQSNAHTSTRSYN